MTSTRQLGIRARYAAMWPVLNWILFGIGTLFCAGVLLGLLDYGAGSVAMGDGWNYWSGEAYTSEHYRYSPHFLWATAPLRALPFEAFMTVWAVLHVVAIAWLAPWAMILAFDDVIRGNVNSFLAVAVVLAARGHAWTWAATLLTKVTPGVGILHHVGRRDWRAVALAVGTTLVLVVVGALIDPGLWSGWLESLRAGTENYQTIDVVAPLPLRLVIGAALCLASARWIWLLPVGMIVAMPGLWPSSFALLAALPRLLADDARARHPQSRR